MSGGWRMTRHAVKRYAERILDEPKQTPHVVMMAAAGLLAAADTAKTTYRYKDKSRVMVTPDGVHLIVRKGQWIVTVLGPGHIAPRCPCMDCIRARGRRNDQRGERR